MVSIRFLILVALWALALSKQVKQRRYNNQWITSGEHDYTCFTQGFSFINSTHILESCGLEDQSYFHILEFSFKNQNQTSMTETYRSQVFPSNIFLEGSILFPPNQLIYILTWTQQIVYLFNSTDFTQILPRLSWTRGEGWGMTHNTTHIFISTGSEQIFVVDQDLNVLEVLPIVNERNIPIKRINELEWVEEDGQQYIYANIWTTNEIVKISIEERKVVLRFQQLKMVSDSKTYPHGSRQDVLNGIAYNKQENIFVLTGKFCPRYFVSYLDFVDI